MFLKNMGANCELNGVVGGEPGADYLSTNSVVYASYRRLLLTEANLHQETVERALRQLHPGTVEERRMEVSLRYGSTGRPEHQYAPRTRP